MKLFGWGRRKDPPPQPIQQIKNSDLKNSHGPITGADRKGVQWGNEFRKTTSPHPFEDRVQYRNLKQQLQAAYSNDDAKSAFHKAVGNNCASEDEKMQETIRFVFTHEQEGLLAIGTFALDQLAGIRNALEENQYEKGADQLFGPGFDTFSCNGGMASENYNYNETVDTDEEDKTWHQRWIPEITSGKKHEHPVFGDHKTECTETDHHKTSECNQSKALTLYKDNNRRSPNGLRPIVLLTALPSDFKKIDPALYNNNTPKLVPHWLESVPPPLSSSVQEDASSDDEYYSTSMCGLFTTKKKFPKGENKAVNCDQANPKKTLTKQGCKGMTMSKLGQLWRATCKGTTSAKVAPEIKTSSVRSSPENNGSSASTFAQRSPTSLLANLQRCPPSKPHLSKALGPPCIANRTERNQHSSATRFTPAGWPLGISSPITDRQPLGNICSTREVQLPSVSSTPTSSPLGSQCATLAQSTSSVSIIGTRHRAETKEKPTADEPTQREPTRRDDDDDEIPQPRDGKWIKTDSEFVVLEM